MAVNPGQEIDGAIEDMWNHSIANIANINPTAENWKGQALPLARIKKIMKSEEAIYQEMERERQVQQAASSGAPAPAQGPTTRFMIAGEAPVLLGKACELLIKELTVRAWRHTERNRRRTLQRQDVHAAVGESEVYDFLIDIVPRITTTQVPPPAPPAPQQPRPYMGPPAAPSPEAPFPGMIQQTEMIGEHQDPNTMTHQFSIPNHPYMMQIQQARMQAEQQHHQQQQPSQQQQQQAPQQQQQQPTPTPAPQPPAPHSQHLMQPPQGAPYGLPATLQTQAQHHAAPAQGGMPHMGIPAQVPQQQMVQHHQQQQHQPLTHAPADPAAIPATIPTVHAWPPAPPNGNSPLPPPPPPAPGV